MFRNEIECIYKSHCIPPHSTSPTMFRLSCYGIGPTFFTTHITSMAIQPILRIISVTGYSNKLIHYICIILHLIVAKSIFCVKRRSHVDTIEPHLIGINLFMPETTILIAWMRVKLTTQQINCFLILLIFRLFINTEKEFPGI